MKKYLIILVCGLGFSIHLRAMEEASVAIGIKYRKSPTDLGPFWINAKVKDTLHSFKEALILGERYSTDWPDLTGRDNLDLPSSKPEDYVLIFGGLSQKQSGNLLVSEVCSIVHLVYKPVELSKERA